MGFESWTSRMTEMDTNLLLYLPPLDLDILHIEEFRDHIP